ncbi:hypothetical protein KJ632_02970, partial [Patescibacteria group bacterium]|nr:hypothetical protein [Patescibacteria group bacterium]
DCLELVLTDRDYDLLEDAKGLNPDLTEVIEAIINGGSLNFSDILELKEYGVPALIYYGKFELLNSVFRQILDERSFDEALQIGIYYLLIFGAFEMLERLENGFCIETDFDFVFKFAESKGVDKETLRGIFANRAKYIGRTQGDVVNEDAFVGQMYEEIFEESNRLTHLRYNDQPLPLLIAVAIRSKMDIC